MSTNQFTLFDIYNNLHVLCKYRNVDIISKQLTETEFIQAAQSEYVIIEGKKNRKPHTRCFIYLLSETSKYASRSAEFRKLEKIFSPISSTTTAELMLVTSDELSQQIKKILAEFATKYPNIYFETYEYYKFLTIIPECNFVPLHVIADEAEVDTFCAKTYMIRQRFPIIRASDTAAVWIGLKPGQTAKIYRYSESVGITVVYRYCIE